MAKRDTTNFIDKLLSPLRFAAGGLIQAPVAGLSGGNVNTADIPLLGRILGLTDEELQKLGGGSTNPDREDLIDPTVKRAGREALTAASYVVPFGRGANIVSKYLAPGAVSGLLQGAGSEGATPATIGKDTLLGSIFAGLLGPAGELVIKAGKGVGKSLSEAGENIALKSLRPSPSQQRIFSKETGEEISSFLKRKNLIGADYEEIDNAIKPLQEKFDEVVTNSNLVIGGDEVAKAFQTRINNLSKSVLPEQKKKAESLKVILENIQEKLSGTQLTADILTGLRREIDDNIRNFSVEPAVKGYLQEARDALQDTLRTIADQKGLRVDNMSVKDAGVELSKLYKLLGIAEKQQYLGKGSQLLNLTSLLGAGAGSAAGGPAGAIGGVVASKVANSPSVVSGLAKGLSGAGDSISSMAPEGLGAILANFGSKQTDLPIGYQETSANNNEPQQEFNDQIDPTVSQFSQEESGSYLSPGGQWRFDVNLDDWVPNEAAADPEQDAGGIAGLTLEQVQQVAVLDALSGGAHAKDLDRLMKLLTPQAEGVSGYTSTQQKEISDIRVSQDILNKLEKSYEISKASKGPIVGRFSSKNPYATETQDLRSEIKTAAQIIGKALEGGVLRAEDTPKYEAMLPNLTDSPAVAKRKMENIRNLLNAQLQIKISTYGGATPDSALYPL